MDCQLDLAAHQIAEISSSGAWNRGEIYAGARHLGTYNGGTTFFNHGDWLGTERARSNVTGVVCETIVSLTYGDGQNTAGTCGDESPMHFTGKMRDTESNLDDFGARYYSSQWGRFVTPDWSATPESIPYALLSNPETLNLYAYAHNNPATNFDIDGHCIFAGGVTCLLQKLRKLFNFFASQPGPENSFPPLIRGTAIIASPYGAAKALRAIWHIPLPPLPSGPTRVALMAVTGFPEGDVAELAGQLGQGLLPVAEGADLQSIIDQLYQPTDALPGGTAGAVRQELQTGGQVGGRSHLIKAAERARQIEKLIARGNLSPRDTVLAKAIVQDLRNALSGK